ncbi:hypothetical protein [Leptospira kirschneri]|uniref:hypothetical protein n=1 Tax=Leptospira kirschneri TaxID=29507 RepID=UPI00046C8341|nr:hypothetical protein [Leptospira kirschneri]
MSIKIEDKEYNELIMQAHSALHDNDIDKVHMVLHKLCGIDEGDAALNLTETLSEFKEFDEKFRYLCSKTKLMAAYILLSPGSEHDANGNVKVRLIAGGTSVALNVLNQYIGDRTKNDHPSRP